MVDENLQELQRFAELGRVSASLLHEISNPLTAALLHLELSNQRSPSIQHAQHTIKLLRRYVEAARQQVRHQSRTEDFWIQPQVDQLLSVVLPLSYQARVKLEVASTLDCQLHGDPVKFQHIISNLIMNAIDAYKNSPSANRLVKLDWEINGAELTILVQDWGRGIKADALPHIFETFTSTKSASGRGLGLGLAITKHHIANDFKGSIKVSSQIDVGTCFTVKLPL